MDTSFRTILVPVKIVATSVFLIGGFVIGYKAMNTDTSMESRAGILRCFKYCSTVNGSEKCTPVTCEHGTNPAKVSSYELKTRSRTCPGKNAVDRTCNPYKETKEIIVNILPTPTPAKNKQGLYYY